MGCHEVCAAHDDLTIPETFQCLDLPLAGLDLAMYIPIAQKPSFSVDLRSVGKDEVGITFLHTPLPHARSAMTGASDTGSCSIFLSFMSLSIWRGLVPIC